MSSLADVLRDLTVSTTGQLSSTFLRIPCMYELDSNSNSELVSYVSGDATNYDQFGVMPARYA